MTTKPIAIFLYRIASRRSLSIIIPSILLLVGLVGLIGLVGCASDSVVQTTAAQHELTDERRAQNIASFEYVWKSVKDKHWDPDLNGIDWDQARTDLLPKVQNASTDNQARAAINELLGRLEQSHFGIIPQSAYTKLQEESAEIEDNTDSSKTDSNNDSDSDSDSDSKPGWSGMNARLINNQFLVTKVVPDSPADQSGIKTGWIIDSIRGRKVSSLIELANTINGVMRPETQAGLIVYSRLHGDAGKTVKMTFIDGDDQTQEIDLTFIESPGIMAGIGELPESPIEVEATTLDQGIGYFRLSMFMSPGTVLPTYQQFIKDHMDAPGIVIDMRGNFGGIILMAPGMINWLIDEKGLMGTMKMRDAQRGPFDIPLMLNPRKKHYTGKVAVLIDEMSISNAEILSAGLKDIGRATIFGTRTAGLALPSIVERLPNGDGFQYAFADYITSGGYSLESNGTTPDIDINYTRQGLLKGHDEVLDAATDWINSNE